VNAVRGKRAAHCVADARPARRRQWESVVATDCVSVDADRDNGTTV